MVESHAQAQPEQVGLSYPVPPLALQPAMEDQTMLSMQAPSAIPPPLDIGAYDEMAASFAHTFS